jgi:hypothetical protein
MLEILQLMYGQLLERAPCDCYHSVTHLSLKSYILFFGPTAGVSLAKCIGVFCLQYFIYSITPVDKTSLTPFFVASTRSQPSKLITEIGS